MSLFDLVFGCWHKRCSFPISARGKLRRSTAAASVTGHMFASITAASVPVRLVTDEDAPVQAPHCEGGRVRHHHSGSQGGLRPALGPSRRRPLHPVRQTICCFLGG